MRVLRLFERSNTRAIERLLEHRTSSWLSARTPCR